MAKQFLTINKQFLRVENYQSVRLHSISLNTRFDQICDLLRKVFQPLSENAITIPTISPRIGFLQGKREFKFVAELKRFLGVFTGITREMSLYQLECLQRMKESNCHQLDASYYQLIQKSKQNQQINQSIDEKVTTIVQCYYKIRNGNAVFQQHIADPTQYYQANLIEREQERLKQQMRKSWRLMSQVLAKRQQIEKRMQYFQPFLSTFKKKLVKNKYAVLKRQIQLARNTKSAVIEIFDSLRRCAQSGRIQFACIAQNEDDDVNYLKQYLRQKMLESAAAENHQEENKKVVRAISECMRQFEEGFDDIEEIMAQLVSYFGHYCSIVAELHESFRSHTLKISEYFLENESPLYLLRQLLETHAFFNKKFQKIILRIQDIQSRLRLQKNSCKKQSQILITLIRVNKHNFRNTIQDLSNNQEMRKLVQHISFKNIKTHILVLYDQFINLQKDLLVGLQKDRHHKKEIYNSMEISHTQREPKSVQKKVPLKTQYWLWKEWKSEVQINFQNYNNYFRDIEKAIEKVKLSTQCKDSGEEHRLQCTLVCKKQLNHGTLIQRAQSLDFSFGEALIRLPWKEIIIMSKNREIFTDFLIIETNRGQLRFKQIQQLDKMLSILLQAHEKGLMKGKRKIERKHEIILSENQMKFIADRQQKIKDSLPDISKYQLIVQQKFNIRIDEFYELFYSDSTFNLYGKEEPCFMSYLGKKSGNYNWIAEKYDKPGPSFYSSQKDISFQNCPLYSSRKITFNHPLKPSPIPFMPQFCLNTDIRKMYWISNELLIYLTETTTQGAPYVDSFQVILAHQIRKIEKNTKLEILLHIHWVKDTFMKSTITDSVVSEVKENMGFHIAELQRALRFIDSSQRGQQIEIEPEPGITKTQSRAPNQLRSLKKANKFLLIGLAGLVLANIIYMLIF